MGLKPRALLPLALLLCLGLRVHDLTTIPAWYWDEGFHINLGENILEGEVAVYGMRISFIPNPPAYHLLAGYVSRAVDEPLTTLRYISLLLSVLSTYLIYLIGSRLLDERTGLAAAVTYALFPSAVYWGRIAHMNNLFLPISLFSVLLLLDYFKSKGCGVLAAAVGVSILAFTVSYTQAALMLSTVVMLWVYDGGVTARKAAFVFTLSMLLYTVLMYAVTGDVFTHELTSHAERFNFKYMLAIPPTLFAAFILLKSRVNLSRVQLVFQNRPCHHVILFYILTATIVLSTPMSDYKFLNGLDYVFIVGTLGLFHLPRTDGGRKLLILSAPIYVLLALTRRTDHALLPMHPYMAFAAAAFISQTYATLKETHVFKSVKWLAVLTAAVLIPMLAYNDLSTFVTGDGLRREDLESNRLLAEYLNPLVAEDDVVLAPSQVTHVLAGRVTTATESAAYDGRNLLYLSRHKSIPKDAFTFNTSLVNVKYAVIEEYTPQWMFDNGYGPVLDEIMRWDGIKIGSYLVYANPGKT
jgi:4-amino-4-deoxy-L-arabinose transferase-like glycosyltransferase